MFCLVFWIGGALTMVEPRGDLIVNLEEFAELCGVTAETMRVHVKAVDGDAAWLIERGARGRGYAIEAMGGLAWWKAKESKWPMLAKMVKQYLAAPASSAGVERVFSAAGKMHGDLHAPEVREGQHARALAVRGVQHGLSPPVGEWGGSGGAGNRLLPGSGAYDLCWPVSVSCSVSAC